MIVDKGILSVSPKYAVLQVTRNSGAILAQLFRNSAQLF